MKYAAHIKFEDEIQSPFFTNTTDCWKWVKDNDPEGYRDGAYAVQGFTEAEIKEMGSQPDV